MYFADQNAHDSISLLEIQLARRARNSLAKQNRFLVTYSVCSQGLSAWQLVLPVDFATGVV
jgi:hypothetical protein